MKVVFYDSGLTIEFTRKEDFVGKALIESLIEMYENNGVDTSPLQHVVDVMNSPTMVQ